MTPEELQIQLQHHRDILFATIDYMISVHGESFVVDNENHIQEHYERQKDQVNKYFKQRRLDRLQQKLATLTNSMERSMDLNFFTYLKEKTGYEINIVEKLRERVDIILSQSEIRNDKEANDIGNMLHYLTEATTPGDEVAKLESLLLQYHNKRKGGKDKYTEVVSIFEKDGITLERITFSTGPKPKHYKEEEIISPDGLRKLIIVQWSYANNASTSITLQFANGASGAIYTAKGIRPDISAMWRDNNTILIKTRKEYDLDIRHSEVRSFDDRIRIEYADIV